MPYLRIQGGTLQRRRIWFDDKRSSIRPTAAVVRDTLFNWLGNDLQGYQCLDFFAGSGILGWEALSRGAQRVYLIEKSKRTCLQLANQLKALSDGNALLQDRVTIICADVLRWIGKSKEHPKADLIFMDPPYSLDYLNKSLELLYTSKDLPEPLIDQDTLIYYETDAAGMRKIEQRREFASYKESKRGQIYFGLLKLVS